MDNTDRTIRDLHAHVSREARDCDGFHGRDYIERVNDDEIAESVKANGINDFSDIHFMDRVFVSCCSPYAVQFGMRVTVTDAGFDWTEDTEEGFRAGEVRWCWDDCPEDD